MTTPAQPRRLTYVQRRALLWLVPACNCTPQYPDVVRAAASLARYHPDLVIKRKMLGRHYASYTLTALGVELRAELMRQDAAGCGARGMSEETPKFTVQERAIAQKLDAMASKPFDDLAFLMDTLKLPRAAQAMVFEALGRKALGRSVELSCYTKTGNAP